MISIKGALEHMSWANQRVYDAVQDLPDEALESYLTNSESTAGKLLEHIVSGAEWYVYLLEFQELRRFTIPRSMEDVAGLQRALMELDSKLIAASGYPDEVIEREVKDETHPIRVSRAILLGQAVHHATEHRAQLIDAFEVRGYAPINLDDIDFWSYANHLRSH